MSVNMKANGTQPLTYSAIRRARTCLRAYYYGMEQMIARETPGEPLTRGSILHEAIEAWNNTHDQAAAMDVLTQFDDLHIRATWQAVILRYTEIYADWHLDGAEEQWSMPLINPATGAPSRTFHLAGKWDGRIGRWLVETKTVSEDISDASQYWARLRVDPQITLYVQAARHAGHDVQGVMYDAIRKPAMAPKQVPMLDDHGLKIVIDDATGKRAENKNGTPKQSAGAGLTMQTRIETPDEWFDRLYQDIGERPSFYFARREIPVLDDEISAHQAEAWHYAKLIMWSRQHGYWPRNIGRSTCSGCDFAGPCLSGIELYPDNLPDGYVCRRDLNPELSNEEN